jgi:membrane-associated phospholipid phosphatase
MRHVNYKIVLLIFLWVISAVISGIYDLEISISFVNGNSRLAMFLQNYGMIPGIIVLLAGIYIYYSNLIRPKSKFRILAKGFLFIAANFLTFYLFYILTTYLTHNENVLYNHYYLISLLSILINVIIITILHIKKFTLSSAAINFSRITIALGFWGYLICIQLVKTLWGRVRFRDLDVLYSQFTPWYQSQGINGFDSFPSGHAAMGWMLLPLILFVNNNIKYLLLGVICVWAVAVAISRVVIGAHYASDVLFGSFFIIFVFIILFKHIDRRDTGLIK